MSDERNEQETYHPIHELSETPFGAKGSGSEGPGASEADEQVAVEQASEPEQHEVEEEISMESAMAGMTSGGVDYSGTFKSLTVGQVVDGVVVHIDREGVLVDVGTKSEGTVKLTELTRDPNVNPEDVVAVGDKIKVFVVESESHEGGPVLSKKRADFENAWDRVEHSLAVGGVIKAMVTDRVKGGLVVDLGIRGFVPASHVGSGKLKNLDKFVGQSIALKVIEVDRERRKVVLSNRLAAEEEQGKLKQETVASLAEGQIREGIVRRITDYGAFVDLGGVDGLLHISEMSWTRINHPKECVAVGQKIQVMVLKLDLQHGRVSLGLRQILPDPWEDVKRIHRVGEVIKGTVSRLVPFGAFVQVEGGVEGIIPNSELAVRRVNNPEDVVSIGQEVEIKVIDLRPDERRLTLSLRQLQVVQERQREETEYRSYSQAKSEASKTTIGDLIGSQLGGLSFGPEEAEKPAKKKSRARAAKKEAMEEAEAENLEDMEEITEVEDVTIPEELVQAHADTPLEVTIGDAVALESEPVAEPEPAAVEETPVAEVEEPAAEAPVEADAETPAEEEVKAEEAPKVEEEPKAEAEAPAEEEPKTEEEAKASE